MGKNRNYTNYSRPSSEVVEPEIMEAVTEATEEVVEETTEDANEPMIGFVVGCVRLRVRKEPSTDAIVLCEIDAGSEVEVDPFGCDGEFYKVVTAAGVEGYCMSKFIEIDA